MYLQKYLSVSEYFKENEIVTKYLNKESIFEIYFKEEIIKIMELIENKDQNTIKLISLIKNKIQQIKSIDKLVSIIQIMGISFLTSGLIYSMHSAYNLTISNSLFLDEANNKSLPSSYLIYQKTSDMDITDFLELDSIKELILYLNEINPDIPQIDLIKKIVLEVDAIIIKDPEVDLMKKIILVNHLIKKTLPKSYSIDEIIILIHSIKNILIEEKFYIYPLIIIMNLIDSEISNILTENINLNEDLKNKLIDNLNIFNDNFCIIQKRDLTLFLSTLLKNSKIPSNIKLIKKTLKILIHKRN